MKIGPPILFQTVNRSCEEITKDEPPSEEWFEQLRQDISDRLHSTFALLQWVMRENSMASVPFLLMKKVPFIDTHTDNPVDWDGLNGLQKQVQFGGEVSKTAHFMALSKPLPERIQSRDSYGNLKLSSIQAPEGRQTAYRLFFKTDEQHAHIFKCGNQHNWFLHQECGNLIRSEQEILAVSTRPCVKMSL